MNFKNASVLFFIMLFVICSGAQAKQDSLQNTTPKAQTRYLQVSTNPSTVDLYTGSLPADFASRPSYTSPAFIPVPEGENNLIISFFHPDYADTTINITLSSSDTSFIIVALRQTYDDEKLLENQELLKHRSRRNLGRNLQWSSTAFFAASGISALVTLYDISNAKDHKKAMENTRIKNARYDEHMQEFKDYKDKAKTAKTVSKVLLGAGLLLLSAGIVLSF